MMKFVPAFAVAVLSMSTSAFAFPGTAATDVPLRSGPGPTHSIIATIDRNSVVEVEGCIETGNWCQVTAGGQRGWVWGATLTTQRGGQTVILSEQRQALQIPTVVYQQQPVAMATAPATTTTTTTTGSTGSTGAAVGATGGVIAGALLGGPIGAVIGGIVGLASGSVVDPPDQVRTYVTTNKVDPVYLDGEVVVGSAIPKTVKVYQVPDYKYQYAYVNGRTVLVEPDSNKIVYVYR